MKVYKCDRCGKELAEITYNPCYSADPDKLVYHIDFGEGDTYELCMECHEYLKKCFKESEGQAPERRSEHERP